MVHSWIEDASLLEDPIMKYQNTRPTLFILKRSLLIEFRVLLFEFFDYKKLEDTSLVFMSIWYAFICGFDLQTLFFRSKQMWTKTMPLHTLLKQAIMILSILTSEVFNDHVSLWSKIITHSIECKDVVWIIQGSTFIFYRNWS